MPHLRQLHLSSKFPFGTVSLEFRVFHSAYLLYCSLCPKAIADKCTRVGTRVSLFQEEHEVWTFYLLEHGSELLTKVLSLSEAVAEVYDDPHRAAKAESALVGGVCRPQA